MTIFLQRASQQYAARQNPYTGSATIPAGTVVNAIKVTLTREAWPVGRVGIASLTFPDGTVVPFPLDGGDLKTRDGTGIATTSSMQWQNGADPLPTGTYTLSFTVLQTVTTALTVERL